MRMLLNDGSGTRDIKDLSFQQNRQAVAIMDCFGRFIPQEGVDYDVEIIFKGAYDPSVAVNIIALTDKGEWWKRYAMEMLKKYPPTVEPPAQSLLEDMSQTEDKPDAQVMS